eukprot:gene2670-5250_t
MKTSRKRILPDDNMNLTDLCGKKARSFSDKLFIHKDTFFCATKSLCIPCLYKIFPNGCDGLPSNQRPETCPRANTSHLSARAFKSGYKILTVGDGDFSFSLSIAKGLLPDITQTENKTEIIATSHESFECIIKTYPASNQNLEQLKQLGVRIYHDIDATSLQSYEVMNPFKNNLDAIIWNFPCVRMENGADAQVNEIELNRSLLRRFFTNIVEYLKDSNPLDTESSINQHGRVYITHKTIEPFCWWNIVQLAEESGLYYNGSIIFDKYLFPGYINRKVLNKKSFPLHDAQ